MSRPARRFRLWPARRQHTDIGTESSTTSAVLWMEQPLSGHLGARPVVGAGHTLDALETLPGSKEHCPGLRQPFQCGRAKECRPGI